MGLVALVRTIAYVPREVGHRGRRCWRILEALEADNSSKETSELENNAEMEEDEAYEEEAVPYVVLVEMEEEAKAQRII